MNPSRSTLFKHLDYKVYLRKRLDDASKETRGSRQRFADSLQVSPAFVTKLLSEDAKTNLSLEQAERANHFFNHCEDEFDYFLFLVSMARAGSDGLRSVFKKKIEEIRSKSLVLKHPEKATDISDDMAAAIISSDWRFGALFVLNAIPGCQDPKTLARRIECTTEEVIPLLDQLVKLGMLRKDEQRYIRSREVLVLKSGFGRADGRQWRMRAISRSFALKPQDIFKGAMLELSEKEFLKLQDFALKLLNEAVRLADQPTVKEKVVRFNLDLFEI